MTINRNLIRNLLISVLFLSGCGLTRNPVPIASMSQAQIPGLHQIRYWEQDYKPDVNNAADSSSDCSFLALSGGGANGAFGAGLLCGWTASGKRPNFRIVTGVSTGALIAPMAFLGPQYDDSLKKYYTTIRTKDIFNVQGVFGIVAILFGESYASTKPLQNLIARLVDEKFLAAIAREHAKGRRLYIGTTDLDAQRFVIWDMGALASSGNPNALKLFRKIMLASAAIPLVFPPVYFTVEVKGKKYDEMHVDGGVIAGVFGYGKLFGETYEVSQQKRPCSIYVIQNGRLEAEPTQVPRKTIKIVGQSLFTLMKAASWNDFFRLYYNAQKDGVDFNYISLPADYKSQAKEMFDNAEMKRLFDLGFEMAKGGAKWQKTFISFGDISGKQ